MRVALGILLGLVYLQAMGQSNLDITSSNILYINQEYAKYNPYNTMFRIDKDAKKMIWYNEYGERSAYLQDIEFKPLSDKAYLGVYCIDGDNCITTSSGSIENYDMTFKDDNGQFPSSGYSINDKLNEIKRDLGVSIKSSGGGLKVDYTKIRENLAYVNAKFSYYNDYDTKFSINTYTGELTCSDNMRQLKAHISRLEFYLDYSSNMFRLRSLSQEEEIGSYDTYGTRQEKAYWSYGMGLNYDDKLISDAPTVVEKLNEIRDMFDIYSEDYVETSLSYVNGMFDKYNDFETSYSADKAYKTLTVKDEYRSYKSYANNTSYEIDENGRFRIYCTDNSTCLMEYDSYGARKDADEDNSAYRMGLNFNDTIIVEGVAIAEIMNSVASIVANGIGTKTASYGTSTDDRLRHINDIFEDHGEYKYIWTVDETYKQLIGKSSYCTLTINLNELDNIYYTTNSSTSYPSGLQIHSDSKGIREACGTSDNYIENKYYYLDSESYTRETISEMLAIKDLVLE
ncbi:MAG: hypothetical protein JXQ87_10925 [Bacteroidia bacterium]